MGVYDYVFGNEKIEDTPDVNQNDPVDNRSILDQIFDEDREMTYHTKQDTSKEIEPPRDVEAELLEQRRVEELESQRRSGEGISGFLGDTLAMGARGLAEGVEAAYKAIEWFTPGTSPEGQEAEEGARGAADFVKDIRENNPYIFGRSKATLDAQREDPNSFRASVMSGIENIAQVAIGGGAGGIAGVIAQFWGSTAQDTFNTIEENEKNGTGK